MEKETKYLIVVVGPTAVGKTALCIRLAQYFQTAIVSADSRQFYKEMHIGTAKPSPEELTQIRHYLIDSHSISEYYSVGQYEVDALQIIHEIFQNHQYVILTGGSGLYVKVVCEGMDLMPASEADIREKLTMRLEQEGLEILLEELKTLDFEYYQQVDKANPQRVLRALEVCIATGKTYSSFRSQSKATRPFEIIKIGLIRPREELYARIEARMDEMLKNGLLEEAKQLLAYSSHNALQTVGYQEIFGFLKQEYDWEETVRLLKRNSRRYAKRQMTWFNKDKEIQWFQPEALEEIIKYIEDKISKRDTTNS